MRRSSEDLVKELIDEPGEFELLGIGMKIRDSSMFVWRGFGMEAKNIERLNFILKAGGTPIGIVGLRRVPGDVSLGFYSRPFAEFSGKKWAEDFLEGLSDFTRRSMARVTLPWEIPRPNDPHSN